MIENKKTWIIIISALLAIVLIIFLLTRIPEKKFNTFTFPTTLIVNNYTQNRMADTITMATLNKVMLCDTMLINIFKMPSIFNNGLEYVIVAFIVKVPFKENMYTIFMVDKTHIESIKTALTHELVHLQQMESGRLKIIDNVGYIWLGGDTVKYSEVKYEDRPYEMEAYATSPKILRKLNKILYKK